MRAFYFAGFSCIRNYLLRLKGKPITRFLCFHDIRREAAEAFRDKMLFLKKSTNVVSLSDFFKGRLSLTRLNIVITFDDGYKSWKEIAMPVMRDLGLPGTFFVSSGFVGLSPQEQLRFVAERLKLPHQTSGSLSREELKQLADAGFTIGGHTHSHCDLAAAENGTLIKQELLHDKNCLEDVTGQKIEYFAYPFGHFENKYVDLASLLEESGFLAAVTVRPGFNQTVSGAERFHLRRDLTDASLPDTAFKARTLGNYDAVACIKKLTSGRMPAFSLVE